MLLNRESAAVYQVGDYVPAGTVAVVRSLLVLRMLKRANRASHIDPPASSYAIMRRACAPTAERTLDPARMFDEELDPRPGIREQPRPKGEVSPIYISARNRTHNSDISAVPGPGWPRPSCSTSVH